MVLSTGKVGFKLPFDNGDSPMIYFNPNDKGIQERIKAFEKKVEERTNKIDTERYKSAFETTLPDIDYSNIDAILALSEDDMNALQVRCDATLEIESEYNKAIKEELNEVFKSNVSDAAFKYCEPLDMVVYADEKGNEQREVYIMQFLRWLASTIAEYGEKNSKAMSKHTSKYTNGTR